MGCIRDFWRASRPILSATRGTGETPAILAGYAIISDAPIQTIRVCSDNRAFKLSPTGKMGVANCANR